MKTIALLTLALLLAVASGCRREDRREFTVTIDNLAETNRDAAVEALARYGGIEKDSYRWDFAAKTLTLRYDSMQLAQENIRQALEAKGLQVRR